MRPIKFRAWDEEARLMVSPELVAQTALEDALEGGVLMQYTGLKDKNGLEIFEGDVVTNAHDRGKVVYKLGGFTATWRHRDYNPHLDVWVENGCAQVEVIGNVYENPELLDKAA